MQGYRGGEHDLGMPAKMKKPLISQRLPWRFELEPLTGLEPVTC
jgi:hypothetical protein